MTRLLVLLSVLFIGTAAALGQAQAKGNLVIVGGGLEPDNKSIFNQLIELAGGPEKASFAVIPAAGGAPVQSYAYFRSELISYGVTAANIHLIPIALIDDDSTRDVNESEWSGNGNNIKLAEMVRNCSAVWFTGGDQLRITKTLIRPDGSRTSVLKAVWDVYEGGGVIGGTSAGAAIMSRVMIGAGTSLAALSQGVIRDYAGDDFPADSGVFLTRGLGFFPHGIMDQHFNQRARIARLAVALMEEKSSPAKKQDFTTNIAGKGNQTGTGLAFGIDENTALIYFGKEDRMKVTGVGGVTMLNRKVAQFSGSGKRSEIQNLLLNYLEEGDQYEFATSKVIPAEGKQSTRGKEKHQDIYTDPFGILSQGSPSFRDLYTLYLTDNKRSEIIRCLTSAIKDSGFLLTFRKTKETEAFHSENEGRKSSYTVINLRMDIIPVSVSVIPINNQY